MRFDALIGNNGVFSLPSGSRSCDPDWDAGFWFLQTLKTCHGCLPPWLPRGHPSQTGSSPQQLQPDRKGFRNHKMNVITWVRAQEQPQLRGLEIKCLPTVRINRAVWRSSYLYCSILWMVCGFKRSVHICDPTLSSRSSLIKGHFYCGQSYISEALARPHLAPRCHSPLWLLTWHLPLWKHNENIISYPSETQACKEKQSGNSPGPKPRPFLFFAFSFNLWMLSKNQNVNVSQINDWRHLNHAHMQQLRPETAGRTNQEEFCSAPYCCDGTRLKLA